MKKQLSLIFCTLFLGSSFGFCMENSNQDRQSKIESSEFFKNDEEYQKSIEKIKIKKPKTNGSLVRLLRSHQ